MRSLRVIAPARLHLGFLDLRGDTGRRFGGLGLALNGPRVRLEAVRARRGEIQASGPDAALVQDLARRTADYANLPGGVSLRVLESIPRHAGLGSGTQMALAVGTAMLRLYGRSADPFLLAARLGRGRRSGIGIGAFAKGGFLLDGGSTGTGIPPVLSQLPFPADWGLLLVMDAQCRGLHGREERDFFHGSFEGPTASAQRLCHLCLMRLLPALAEMDCAAFGEALRDLQHAMSRSFSAVQGGPYTSPRVGRVLHWLQREAGALSHGQSSWGPTGFALFASHVAARRAREAALRHCPQDSVHLLPAAGRNRGASVYRVRTGRR